MNATVMTAPERPGRTGWYAEGRRRSRPGPPGGRFFGVAARPRTYAHILYMAASFVLGLAYFVFLTTMLAIGGGMAVTVVGLPVLGLVMYAWCLIADGDRLFTNALLATRISPLRFKQAQEKSVWAQV